MFEFTKILKLFDLFDLATIVSAILILLDDVLDHTQVPAIGPITTCFMFFFFSNLSITRHKGLLGLGLYVVFWLIKISSGLYLSITQHNKFIMFLINDLLYGLMAFTIFFIKLKHINIESHIRKLTGRNLTGDELKLTQIKHPVSRLHLFGAWVNSVAWFLPYLVIVDSKNMPLISAFSLGSYYKMFFEYYYVLTKNALIRLTFIIGVITCGVSVWTFVFQISDSNSSNNDFGSWEVISQSTFCLFQLSIWVRMLELSIVMDVTKFTPKIDLKLRRLTTTHTPGETSLSNL